MAVIFLTEQDVERLVDMPAAIETVEESFRQLAGDAARNVPRARARASGSGLLLHTMSATAEYLGLAGWKAYTTTRHGARFHVAAYDVDTGEMRVLIEANRLGQLRTGAASGVATRHMARTDAVRVGLLGAGWQAESQLEAVCCVRPIEQVRVFCRSREGREAFATRMASRCGVRVDPVDSPEAAVDQADILVTATTAREPLFTGDRIAAGTHLNVIGSNFLAKSEVDTVAVERAAVIACDSIEQCRIEAGELAAAVEADRLSWENCVELADIVAGRIPGRHHDEEITLFKSVGLALEDVAMAGLLLERAREQDVGTELPL